MTVDIRPDALCMYSSLRYVTFASKLEQVLSTLLACN